MTIWQQLPIQEHFTRYSHEVYRLVEGQYYISTRPLVDSDEEHDILEAILDNSKPIAPTYNKKGVLHYLLFTPFRYPPLKTGGRFHTRLEQSPFYGSHELQTAMAEVAYGRFLFNAHTQAEFSPMQVSYTHFVARLASNNALYLTKKPFQVYREHLSHPSSYTFSQPFGKAMRAAGVEVFTFFSARKTDGVNVGVFTVEAFAHNTPLKGKEGHWSVFVTHEVVEFTRTHMIDNAKESHVFRHKDFYIDGIFPAIS